MNKFLRNAALYIWHSIVCVGVLGSLFAVLLLSLYSLSVHRQHNAGKLLRVIQSLQFDASDELNIQRAAKELRGSEHCEADSCSYKFDNAFGVTGSPFLLPLRRTEMDYFGLRPWRLEAEIQTRNSRTTSIQVTTAVGRGRGWLYHDGLLSGAMWGTLLVSTRVDSPQFQQELEVEREYVRKNAIQTGHQIEPGEAGLIVSKPNLDTPGGGEALAVLLSPAASGESRRAGFDLNLRCATAMSSCTELCQLAPSAWKSYSEFQHSNGWYADNPDVCGSR